MVGVAVAVSDLRNRTQIGVWAAEHGLYRSDQGQQVEDEPAGRRRWLGSTIGQQPQRSATADDTTDVDSGA